MIEDPIVEEIRRHREAHASKHGNDLSRIVEALRRRERESARLVNPRGQRDGRGGIGDVRS